MLLEVCLDCRYYACCRSALVSWRRGRGGCLDEGWRHFLRMAAVRGIYCVLLCVCVQSWLGCDLAALLGTARLTTVHVRCAVEVSPAKCVLNEAVGGVGWDRDGRFQRPNDRESRKLDCAPTPPTASCCFQLAFPTCVCRDVFFLTGMPCIQVAGSRRMSGRLIQGVPTGVPCELPTDGNLLCSIWRIVVAWWLPEKFPLQTWRK